ncbi:MAG TPA: glutaminyl-peptide cyclotransferase [Flavisolibacter sp.]|nr:glutaminyl-peptide cyclotransferase [Flavisolibacter sp.]
MKRSFRICLSILSIFFIGCANDNNSSPASPSPTTNTVPALSYNVVASQPHDTSYFTEGLEFYQGSLLESTGNYGSSKLVKLDPATGKVQKEVTLDPKFFGEGITVVHDTLYQMTWREHTVHVYTAKDLKKVKDLPLNYEGWGLTNDGKNIIASDGSSNLYFYEPGTFRLLRIQGVTENGDNVININELEYINGYVWANQWNYNDILKIDPSNGQVVAKIDLTDLANKVAAKDPHANVLNGIAYNPDTKKIYITGKYWPELYEVSFDH